MRRVLALLPLLLVVPPACGGSNKGAPGPCLDGGALDATASSSGSGSGGGGASVLQFHNHANRDGVFQDPQMTAAAAAKMHMDPTFHPTCIDGNVYAQPLYVDGSPIGNIFIVVTENNNVYALDETGAQKWLRALGTPAATPDNCGNIKPLGITGTPVVDLAHGAVYLDAAMPGATTTNMREHEIHALSLTDGTEFPGGWPVKASTVKGVMGASAQTMPFKPNPQNERGALLVVGNTLYVPYGGHSGDCADSDGASYHGWVIGVPLDDPAGVTGFVTQGKESGLWSVGGLASDGTNIFGTTGNANGGQNCPAPTPTSPPPGWVQQEAILRFQAGPVWSGQTTDYWAPDDWPCLDNGDVDIGGSSPVLVDLPGGSPQHLVVALGKDGKIYVADSTNLGGVGVPVAVKQIASSEIKNAPTAFTTPGGTYVVTYADTTTVGCPAGQSGNLIAVKITPGAAGQPPTLDVAWCADEHGQGSPIFTTSDGVHDNLVWAIGGDFSNQLRAWDADTGAVVFDGGGSGDVANGFHHFSTILAVKGRIFAGADNTMYAFTPQP